MFSTIKYAVIAIFILKEIGGVTAAACADFMNKMSNLTEVKNVMFEWMLIFNRSEDNKIDHLEWHLDIIKTRPPQSNIARHGLRAVHHNSAPFAELQ